MPFPYPDRARSIRLTSTATDTAIEIQGLTKYYGQVKALDGLDLHVPAGSVFGFLGPNGAGKTTALSILAGLSHSTSGEATISGLNVEEQGMQVRQRIGFLRQDPRFYTWMTGRETLQFTGRFFEHDHREIDRRADELLDLVDLTGAAKRKMGSYSGGMRQRLGVAQALMGKPEVLLLDEPSSALDPAGRYEVLRIMERLRGSTTVFYSTHILQDVERVADEVAIINNGKRLLQAPMRQLLAGEQLALLVEIEGNAAPLIDEIKRQPFLISLSATDGEADRHRLRIEVNDLTTARRALPAMIVHAGVLLLSFQAERHSLEDVFLSLTQGQSGDIQA
jgi:ABC-2 type transport system ATP-binding protein